MATTDPLTSGPNVTSPVVPTTSSTSASAGLDQISSDFTFFLTMLTTQLKNQDPTSPLDTNEFTQQIAQYSAVQQQVLANQNLEKLIAASNQSAVTTAVSYIGKEIETAGNTGVVAGGQGAFSYILPSTAASVEITIKNSAGQTVFTGAGRTTSGRNLVVWDGVNSNTGQQEPDGVYTISINAKNGSNQAITAETRAVAVVNGVESAADGAVMLSTGNGTVAMDDVLAVRAPTWADLSIASAATGTSS